MSDVAYFAVLDPSNAGQMTYWRRGARGLKPWPAKARYGPALYRSDVPAGLLGAAQRDWVEAWFAEHHRPWHAAIREAIDTDPDGCRARFAAFASRCCCCGRELRDPASKVYGIGPECRRGMPDGALAGFAEAMGRVHAEAVTS